MLRKFVVSALALVVCTVGLLAEEYKGKVKSVDVDKNTITVTIDDKEKTFTINDETKILNPAGKDMKGRLKSKQFEKAGAQLTIVTEKKGDKEVVKEIKLKGKQ